MNKNQASIHPLVKVTIASVSSTLFGIILLLNASPALAHHPNGGQIPSNFIQGFLSGIGHPVIGIDHLVFTIAIGLLAALSSNKLGTIVPGAFVVATAIGTGIHLQNVDLPAAEIIISVSVLVMGILLAKAKQTNLALVTLLGAIAGIFHGYAYGESIVGAESTALGAYLLGFCGIQLAISAIAFYTGRLALSKVSLALRFAGFAIAGVGFAFVSSAVLG